MSRVLLTNRNYNGRRLKRIGCALLILLALPLTILKIVDLHTIHAGLWAAQSMIPAYPSSRLLEHSWVYDLTYNIEIDVYATSASIVDIKDWFSSYIQMSEASPRRYYSVFRPYKMSNEYVFYVMAGNVTRRIPGRTVTYDEMPDCFQVNIVAPDAISDSPFQAYLQEIDSINTIQDVLVMIQACWPNWHPDLR